MDVRRTARLAACLGSAVLAATAPACGARSGVDLAVLEMALDAGSRDAAVRDAGRLEATDAPRPGCPPPSDFGFAVHVGGELDVAGPVDDLSLGGDGVSVFFAVRRAGAVSAVSLHALDPSARTATEVFVLERGDLPRVSVVAGVARMTADLAETDTVLVEVREGVAREVGHTEIFRGAPSQMSAPAWNGRDVVMAGSDGFELFLGAFLPGTTSVAWRNFGPARDVHVVAQPETGITELLYRAGDDSLRVESFGIDGAALWPPGGVALEDVGFIGPVDFGWLDADGTGQPHVVAGFASGPDGVRATLRRFRVDGRAAGGFSAPPSRTGGVALTTVPPPGHRHGYGMVASARGGATIFHGAGEDFVGDARPVPLPCDGDHVSIAAGPCGYVIACLGAGRVHTALAVPPMPR